MKFMKWCLVLVGIVTFGIAALSEAFEIKLQQGKIEEFVEYGKKYKGKEIFSSPVVKSACFGKYPDGEGGLIMSKYVRIAVISAMMAINDKILTKEDIKKIEESTSFDVVVTVPEEYAKAPEDIQIMLKQGTNNILPLKTEFGMKRKDTLRTLVGTFQYEKVNPKANAAIIVKTRKVQKKYTIDFSDVK
ncbi:MAG: hypothetical protein Q7J76_04040 [Candidatus Brocadiaceae bacterium]|uniref:hypothetical protein n=1 Tax=Candidatus Wunengus sp. YC61 TaxID=3367698 RepID=UPI0027226E3D|nr:hypothetical protein [Candidatus Brocadiaceae bacterium]